MSMSDMSMMNAAEDAAEGEYDDPAIDLWNGPAPMPPGYSPGGSDAMVKALNSPCDRE